MSTAAPRIGAMMVPVGRLPRLDWAGVLLTCLGLGGLTYAAGQAGALDGVVQSGRRVRERPGIEHRADRLPGLDRRFRFMDPVDQLALVI